MEKVRNSFSYAHEVRHLSRRPEDVPGIHSRIACRSCRRKPSKLVTICDLGHPSECDSRSRNFASLPQVAGVLYEWSKRRHNLPLGSLPYLVGSVFPLVGVAVPFMLYLRSIEEKVRLMCLVC